MPSSRAWRAEAVQPGAVDTHCHLFLIEEDAAAVVRAANDAGVDTLICVGIDPASSRRSLELADFFDGVYATVGMHPHTASDLKGTARAEISQLLSHPKVVAAGETGLDFFRMLSPRTDQETSLRFHAALARESGKPLVVHVRDAWSDVLRILEEESGERVVLHCFSGDAALARECAARGYFVSFAGNVTYPKNEHLREAAAAVLLDRLLVETDSPFLSPQPLRGRDNTPSNVRLVIEEVARVRGEPPEAVSEATRSNARAAFRGLE